MQYSSTLFALLTFLVSAASFAAAEDDLPPPPEFNITQGLRISVIGNTLAERMQHDGWMETMFQSRFPDQQLVFRNLGFSADAVDARLRVEGFGSQDEWLERTRADAVFVFFGFNESFAGPEGISEFQSKLTDMIRGLLGNEYNSEGPPAIVLFSPIAQEDLGNPHLPDVGQCNLRLESYANAVAEVASKMGVKHVDLFKPTLAAYAAAEQPLTINGIHLNENGNRVVAQIIDAALFPGSTARRPVPLREIREAVVDKNFYWFHRYQPTDGYNVHGGRSHLEFDGLTNRVVMMREMEILEALTANRDRNVWARAQGSDLVIDDSNVPEHIPVKTNLPGDGPDGSQHFLGGQEAIEKMTIAEGMQVNLFASEEQFPELINPVQMAFDAGGRLFVCAWPSYPHWKPQDEMNDKLLIVEDTDGDGMADQCTTFADGLHNPTGFEFWGGGVFVANQPDLLFLKDTDGDGRADVRIRALHGFSSGDTHHAINSFVLGPGGALYFGEGVFHRTQIETPWETVRNVDACAWRVEPRTWKVDRYIPYGFANPHGHVFDRWGQGFFHDGTSAVPFHATLFSGHIDYPGRHNKPPELYGKRTRPCPATEILSSAHFPEENQDNLLVLNVIGVQGILQYKFSDAESSFTATEVEPILLSTDRNFRPVDAEIGADGALYFTDWQNPIIGHMQHHIRDPNRDQTHGRVYRITCTDRPLLMPAPVVDQPVDALLDLLEQRDNRVRHRARIELSDRETDEVIAGVKKWTASLSEDDPDHEHHMLEALWVHQQHNVVNEELLARMLQSSDYRARAAATRVLCYWHDRLADPLDQLELMVNDEHPRVRLEAVRACSFVPSSRALDTALLVLIQPMDKYLQYTLDETTRQLEKYAQ